MHFINFGLGCYVNLMLRTINPKISASLLPLGVLLLLASPWFSFAACDIPVPNSGQTTTCSTSIPNPGTVPVTAQLNSQNVTVNIDSGAGLTVADQNAVSIESNSIINNYGAINLSGDNINALSASLAGNLLNNVGSLSVSGDNSTGMHVSAAGNTLSNQGGYFNPGISGIRDGG